MASATADAPPQQKLARRHDHPRFIVGASNPGSLCARSPRATRVGGGGEGGQAPSGPSDPCGRTVVLSHVTLFAFSVIATLPTLTRPQIRIWISLRTRMQTATSETERKSLVLSICVHHYTLRAPCPKGQGKVVMTARLCDLSSTGSICGLFLATMLSLSAMTDSCVCIRALPLAFVNQYHYLSSSLLMWSLRQKLDSLRQADRRLDQSNAQKILFDRPGLSTFWRNDNTGVSRSNPSAFPRRPSDTK